ncbi:MAG: xanthine dehydrogenase family protein molybdopterin-binding subunit, partial [bacterium]
MNTEDDTNRTDEPGEQYETVGVTTERVDGPKLAAGRGGFTDDVHKQDLLHIKVLRSPHAHARVADMDVSGARSMDSVHQVLYHENVPRKKYTTAGQGWPEPSAHDQVMFDKVLRFAGDRVAAVAAESPEKAQRALENIDVEYDVREPILDPHRARADDAPRIHTDKDPQGIADPDRNVAAELHAEHGDVEEGFKQADHVIENTFEVTKVQQTPMEPHISIGWMDEDGRLNLRASTQVPYHVRRIVSYVLDLDVKDIRVNKPRIGGGFGVKQEVLIQDLVGMMAVRTDRPCKLELTREEEFKASRSRHPYTVTMKTGVDEDGTIRANSMQVLSDTGAHGTHGLTVASVTGSKTIPLYKAENVLFDATVVYTNHPPAGAYRGYGAPQGFFPLESHMEEVARAIGADSVGFRHEHHIDVGDENVLAVPLGEGGEGPPMVIRSCGLDECIEKGKRAI